MTDHSHFTQLENMYAAAPINQIYQPILVVTEGQATIEIELSEQYHHSAGGVHGMPVFCHQAWLSNGDSRPKPSFS